MIAEFVADTLTQFISQFGYFAVIFLMTLESACMPVPSEIVMPFAGYLAFQGILDVWIVSLAGAFGCMLGSIISWWVGLKGGRKFIEKYGKYFLLNPKHLRLAEKWFEKYGDLAVFGSRLVPVIRTFISLPAGIGKYSFKKLVIFSFVGSVPWCLMLAWIGYTLGPHWERIIGFFNKLDLLIIAGIVVFIFYKIQK
jgi:membrane protein DedA with SNARE-associated domain